MLTTDSILIKPTGSSILYMINVPLPPYHFSLYTNDFVICANLFNFTLCADDATLYTAGPKIPNHQCQPQPEPRKQMDSL